MALWIRWQCGHPRDYRKGKREGRRGQGNVDTHVTTVEGDVDAHATAKRRLPITWAAWGAWHRQLDTTDSHSIGGCPGPRLMSAFDVLTTVGGAMPGLH